MVRLITHQDATLLSPETVIHPNMVQKGGRCGRYTSGSCDELSEIPGIKYIQIFINMSIWAEQVIIKVSHYAVFSVADARIEMPLVYSSSTSKSSICYLLK